MELVVLTSSPLFYFLLPLAGQDLLPPPPPLRGRIEEGGLAVIERRPNHLFDRHPLLQGLCIPEPQNPEAFSFQPRGPPRILFRLFRVLSAVHLDAEPLLQTDEIDDVRPQALLAPKLVPTELPQT